MFEQAIEKAAAFTRPLHTLSRTYDGKILPGTGTLFFVNDHGVAITCKHVASLMPTADEINTNFQKFRAEREKIPKDQKYKSNLKGLELKYKYRNETTVQLKNNFINCFDSIEQVTYHLHPTLDLAILEFKGYKNILYSSFATFIKDGSCIKQGNYLCRIGYPFPEFNNFSHDVATDDIVWTKEGVTHSPLFPIDGIVTRFLGDPSGNVMGIELSTPGLKGQSGGPLFNTDGVVYGMQFATNHLHLGFDIRDREIIDGGKNTKVSNYPFLNVGLCVHAEEIKKFLREHKIQFHETD